PRVHLGFVDSLQQRHHLGPLGIARGETVGEGPKCGAQVVAAVVVGDTKDIVRLATVKQSLAPAIRAHVESLIRHPRLVGGRHSYPPSFAPSTSFIRVANSIGFCWNRASCP